MDNKICLENFKINLNRSQLGTLAHLLARYIKDNQEKSSCSNDLKSFIFRDCVHIKDKINFWLTNDQDILPIVKDKLYLNTLKNQMENFSYLGEK